MTKLGTIQREVKPESNSSNKNETLQFLECEH